MLNAQRDSLRQLWAILAACIGLPAILFCYTAWLSYTNTQQIAQRQIEQTRDVLTEHALKVFESVERSMAEINEIVRDMSDAEIASKQEMLHKRLSRIADSSDQIKSLWLFGRDGRALVTSLGYPALPLDYSDRDYFKAHVEREVGVFVGEVLRPRSPYGGAPFFGASRRRTSPDGTFAGVIQVSLLPDYFEGFYAKISRDPGSLSALIRSDGHILARYPPLNREATIGADATMLRRVRDGHSEGSLTMISTVDAVERIVAYRQLPNLPVHVVAGLETSAVRSRWLAQMANNLLFGLPATAALVAIVLLAIRRTRSLYAEAERRLQAEEAMRRSQRLESLGRLTGGVAHDFNNLLMVIGGAVQKLRRRHSDQQDGRTFDMIDSAVAKGASLTRQLLSFSRRHSVSAEVVDLGGCIERFSEVLKQSVRSDIAIAIHRPAEPVMAKVDPNEFEIALLNLTLNARDAMPDGGQITIAVGRRRLDKSEAEGLAGDFAEVLFADTGVGIPPDIRDRIFEPFFTTKPVDRGTGLGLSQIYGFAQQSGGAVTVESEIGRGATFRLLLPLTTETSAAGVAAEPRSVETIAATLLLVEDHPDVAQVAIDYAQQCGFKVVHAPSAEAAIEVLNRRDDIDLVFSDIVMPGMSGLELARLIREHHPETPVVLASGYSDRASQALQEGFSILQKPYTLDAFRTALTEANDRRYSGVRTAAG